MNRGRRSFFYFTVILIGLFLVAWFYYFYAIKRVNYSSDRMDKSEIEFIIKPGEKVYEIAQHLKEARLINSPTLFKIYVKLNGLAVNLQAGRYKIRRNLSLVEVVDLLRHGRFDIRLTLPEGWRREEMAVYIAEAFKSQNLNFRATEFLELTKGMEGFLFPDTYDVPYNIEVPVLVKLMRDNFDRQVDDVVRRDLGKQNLSLEQAVIIASIVEREAGDDKDRTVIAGILLKRLRSDWPLEADATVQYAMALSNPPADGKSWWPKFIGSQEVKIDSPYNTRKNRGLPAGPISNPGIASIKAVVYPLETSYWYYLTDRAGTTHYAKTLEEHESNTEKFLP